MKDEAIKLVKKVQMNANSKNKSGGNGSDGGDLLVGSVFIIFCIFILVALFKSFYTVDIEEEAVVTRFGQYLDTTQPGLHFKIPFIDDVYKVQSKKRQEAVFGFRKIRTSRRDRGSESAARGGRRVASTEESLMLTGDLNLADVEWSVQYEISDPKKYLFNAKDVTKTVRDVSMSAVRQVVGDRLVGEVLTTGRAEISIKVQELMQKTLESYDLGLNVTAVMLQSVNPPDKVKPAFNDVNAAKQEKEQAINRAERQYNSVIPQARGKAEKELADANAYSVRIVNRAKGDGARFTQVFKEYKKAPRVTKTRIYLETMEEIFEHISNFTIVDEGAKGLLPIYGNSKSVQKIIK